MHHYLSFNFMESRDPWEQLATAKHLLNANGGHEERRERRGDFPFNNRKYGVVVVPSRSRTLLCLLCIALKPMWSILLTTSTVYTALEKNTRY